MFDGGSNAAVCSVPAGREQPQLGMGNASSAGVGVSGASSEFLAAAGAPAAAAIRFLLCPLPTELGGIGYPSHVWDVFWSQSASLGGANDVPSSWEEAYFCFLKLIPYSCRRGAWFILFKWISCKERLLDSQILLSAAVGEFIHLLLNFAPPSDHSFRLFFFF